VLEHFVLKCPEIKYFNMNDFITMREVTLDLWKYYDNGRIFFGPCALSE